jgi:hypothetical protein
VQSGCVHHHDAILAAIVVESATKAYESRLAPRE